MNSLREVIPASLKLLAFIWITSLCMSCAPDLSSPDITVTLIVDTENITRSNFAQEVRFRGQPAGTSLEDYTIEVLRGEVIEWNGVPESASSADSVQITMIQYEKNFNGNEFKNVLRAKNNVPKRERPGVVMGKVKKRKRVIDKTEKYKLFFQVYINGTATLGTLIIDPKIRVLRSRNL